MKLQSLISFVSLLLLGMVIQVPEVGGSEISNSTRGQSKVLVQNHYYHHCNRIGQGNNVLKSLLAFGKEMKVQFDRLRKEMNSSTQKHDQQHANVVARIIRLEKEVKTVKTSQSKLKEEIKEELGQLNEYVNASRMEMKLAKRENDRQLAVLAKGVEVLNKSQMEVKKEMKGEFDHLNKNVDASRMEMKKTTQEQDRNLTNAIGKTIEKGVKNLASSQTVLKKKLLHLSKNIGDYGMEMKKAMAKCVRTKNKNNAQYVIRLQNINQKMNAALCARDAPSLGAAAGGRLSNSRFTASSKYDFRYLAKYGRLDYHRTDQRAWAPNGNNKPLDYLQVDLGALKVICAVATQGCPQHSGVPEWTTTYKLSLSSDGSMWHVYQDNNSDKVFNGNTDSVSVVKNALPRPIQARYVRFIPITYHRYKVLRVDVYGHSY